MAVGVHHRIAGYMVTLVLHFYTSNVITTKIENSLQKEADPDMLHMKSIQYDYFTIWNIIFQAVYAFFSMSCDLLMLLTDNSGKVTRYMDIREKLFRYILWPSGLVVFTIFWSIYFSDRRLIFPIYAEKVISTDVNLVIHGFILLFLLWEMRYLPRNAKLEHKQAVTAFSMIFISYFTWTHLAYFFKGTWPYPVAEYTCGTRHHITIWLIAYATMVCVYFIQYPLTCLLCKDMKKRT